MSSQVFGMKSIREALEEDFDIPDELKKYASQIKTLEELHKKSMNLLSSYYHEIRQVELKYAREANALAQEKQKVVLGHGSSEPIPDFWRTVILNHPEISQLVCEQDMEALAALTNISVELLADNEGFRLIFEFAENKFFSNKSLTKTYLLGRHDYNFEVFYDSFTGCEIDWKPEHNLTQKITSKTQRHKTSGEVRVIKSTEKTDSFFDFFASYAVPENLDEVDDEALAELEGKLHDDFTIAEIFKTKLIPYSVDWFTGKALQFEDNESDYSYDDGDDDCDGQND